MFQLVDQHVCVQQFWLREWLKSGTCSGLSQLAYFSLIIALSERMPTPQLVRDNVGNTVSLSSLREAFGALIPLADVSCNDTTANGGVLLHDDSASWAFGDSSSSAMQQARGSPVLLGCRVDLEGRGFLRDVTTCWNRKLQPVWCPDSVVAQSTAQCPSEVVIEALPVATPSVSSGPPPTRNEL